MGKKKLSALIIMAFFMAIFLGGCGTDVSKKGIENYSPADSSFGITSYLLPSDENGITDKANTGYQFLENYEFIDGGYFYAYSEDSPYTNIRDTAFMWLQYDAAVYKEAKAYMLDTTPLSEESSYHYNDYCFYERITSGGGTNMLGYNDAKNILIFYGIYTSGTNYETMTQYIDHSDWEGFFKAFYPEYDFDNER